MSLLRRLTTQDTKHKSQYTKFESQKFETQNSKHPYTKHNVPYRLRLPYLSDKVVLLVSTYNTIAQLHVVSDFKTLMQETTQTRSGVPSDLYGIYYSKFDKHQDLIFVF